MRSAVFLFYIATSVLIAAIVPPQAKADDEISGFAVMQDDGVLKISGYLVHLYGVYIPPTEQSCYTFINPLQCGTRPALALNFKIEGDFVHCTQRVRHTDDSITATCTLSGVDLSEWMLQHGWAVALPDAPPQYEALERIAQTRRIGIWGIPVEKIRQHRAS